MAIRTGTTHALRGLSTAVLLALCLSPGEAAWYVATDGSDANPGSFELPFATIPRAVSASVPGDTILVRGGVYNLSTTISLSVSGTASLRRFLLAFPGERPVLDFSAMPVGSSNRGINLGGSYWHLKGLDVRRAGDNGMRITGSHNVVEFCAFIENSDSGLQLDNGASNNQVINCDSYYNADPGQGNADGFAPKLTVGSGNRLSGCRAWQNSDDGYDGYLRGADDVSTVLENCWVFMNGYLKNGTPSTGNGNGFKLGGSDDRTLMHNVVLRNCLAFDNRVKGFDQNNNKGSMTLYHSTGYRNGTNYSFPQALNTGKTLTLKNCAVLGAAGTIGAFAVQQTNSWMPPFAVTPDDFSGLDTAGLRGPRGPDGSLPVLAFLRLAGGSDLIDGGTDLGYPYSGAAPDLGAFEYEGPLASFTPSILSFGPTYTGLTRTDTVRVANTGPELLVLDSALVRGAEFHITPGGPCTIGPGSSQAFAVSFTPADTGARQGTTLFFSNAYTSPDTVPLSGTGLPWVTTGLYGVREFWNLLSLPLDVEDPRPGSVFPGAAGGAFLFDPQGGYAEAETLRSGRGYWLKFPSAQEVSITGGVRRADTVDLSSDWNCVGGISEPVAVSAVGEDPPGILLTPFYLYDGAGYAAADTLRPAAGYWVKAGGSGRVFLQALPAGPGARTHPGEKESRRHRDDERSER
ncbi:MAG: right-handed parallel beta-helix repeat-containing protein [Bacteroidota bacterium]